MRNIVTRVIMASIFLIVIAGYCYAAIPKLITYQGILMDSSNQVINGTRNLTFRLYNDDDAGDTVWKESQSNVSISQGHFSVTLGSVTTLTPDFSIPYWLSIEVDDDGQMIPRQRLTAAGYAVRADVANTIADSALSITADDGPLAITVPSGGGNEGITITQNDTTNNPKGMILTNASAGNALYIDQNGVGKAINIDAETTGDNVVYIKANALTDGRVLTATSLASNTTYREIGLFNNGSSAATGAISLKVNQEANGRALLVTSQATSYQGDVCVSSHTTSGMSVLLYGDYLTTGNTMFVTSESSDTSNRYLVEIQNFSSSATGAKCLRLKQNSTANIIEVYGNAAKLTAGGTWTDASSSELKENFQDMDVLAKVENLPIQKFNYKQEGRKTPESITKERDELLLKFDAKEEANIANSLKLAAETGKDVEVEEARLRAEKNGKRAKIIQDYQALSESEPARDIPEHFGPTAEEFFAEFGLGDDKSISGRDLAAVALKAVQELTARVKELEAEVQILKGK